MQKTVLVVDDNLLMRRDMSAILTEGGFNVVGGAASGLEALELYRTLRPDLVIMDIHMPGVDGIEATRTLLKHDPAAKVVMCTTTSHQDAVVAAVRAGAKDFIVKPYAKERVISAAARVLGLI